MCCGRRTWLAAIASPRSTGSFSLHRSVIVTDGRCNGVSTEWGLAIIAKGTPFSGRTANFLGYDPSGEVRRLFCANTARGGIGFKVCSSHIASLRNDDYADANRAQFATMRNYMNSMAESDIAAVLGADLNRNSRVCGTSSIVMLQTIYVGIVGGGTAGGCASGSGNYYEADHYNGASGDQWDEPTLGSTKID